MNIFTRTAILIEKAIALISEPAAIVETIETSEPAATVETLVELSYFDTMTEAQWLQVESNYYQDAATLEILEEATQITLDFVIANQAAFEVETAYAATIENSEPLAGSIAFAEDCLALVEQARAAAFALFAQTQLEIAVAVDSAYFGSSEFTWSE